MTQTKQEMSTVRDLMDERDEARFNAAATRGMLEAAMRKVATLTARNAAMAEALKPFAAKSKKFDDANTAMRLPLAGDTIVPRAAFTHAQLRAARRELENKP